MRVIRRDTTILFGPIREQTLDVLNRHREFDGHGICVLTEQTGVEIYATLPYTATNKQALERWILKNPQVNRALT
jgi:hypothetical protein